MVRLFKIRTQKNFASFRSFEPNQRCFKFCCPYISGIIDFINYILMIECFKEEMIFNLAQTASLFQLCHQWQVHSTCLDYKYLKKNLTLCKFLQLFCDLIYMYCSICKPFISL